MQQSEPFLQQFLTANHSHLQVMLLREVFSDLREELRSALHITSSVPPLPSLVASERQIDQSFRVGHRREEGYGGGGVWLRLPAELVSRGEEL